MSPRPADAWPQYLATWVIARAAGRAEAEEAIRYVAPVGEKDAYVERALAAVSPFLPAQADAA